MSYVEIYFLLVLISVFYFVVVGIIDYKDEAKKTDINNAIDTLKCAIGDICNTAGVPVGCFIAALVLLCAVATLPVRMMYEEMLKIFNTVRMTFYL